MVRPFQALALRDDYQVTILVGTCMQDPWESLHRSYMHLELCGRGMGLPSNCSNVIFVHHALLNVFDHSVVPHVCVFVCRSRRRACTVHAYPLAVNMD
jgi:hypothetical protein